MSLPFSRISTKPDIGNDGNSVDISIGTPMPTMGSEEAIALGLIPGYASVNKYGRSTDVDSGVATDIWDGANATLAQPIWLAPTAARIHAIVSSSASDDGDPAGVGAQTVQVYGLTDWDTAEVSESVTLNGVGAVNTVNAYVIIHRMKVTAFGATSVNVGIIKATAASDNTITAQINAGQGQTQMAIYGVPSIQKALITQFYASVLKATSAVRADIALLANPIPDVEETGFLVKHTLGLTTTGSSLALHTYIPCKKFDGPCIIKMQASGSAANIDVDAGFDLVLVDN